MFSKIKKIIKWITSTFGVALVYIFGMLIFRETHPFSRFPMYSSFPNWAYSFYLTDENDKIIPLSSLETNGSSLGHLFGSVSDELSIPYGNFMESDEDLLRIGKRMMEILTEGRDLEADQLELHRKAFYYKNDSITGQDIIMTYYEGY
tara:strand:- start:2198 stop:2641 length:444 start_codon:yes stop_codon:yes gene_type:complete